jgi:hypothetical protein
MTTRVDMPNPPQLLVSVDALRRHAGSEKPTLDIDAELTGVSRNREFGVPMVPIRARSVKSMLVQSSIDGATFGTLGDLARQFETTEMRLQAALERSAPKPSLYTLTGAPMWDILDARNALSSSTLKSQVASRLALRPPGAFLAPLLLVPAIAVASSRAAGSNSDGIEVLEGKKVSQSFGTAMAAGGVGATLVGFGWWEPGVRRAGSGLLAGAGLAATVGVIANSLSNRGGAK